MVFVGVNIVAIGLVLSSATAVFADMPAKVFVPQHQYYIAPYGHCSDSNSGKSARQPWCQDRLGDGVTAFKCGDVVVAARGEYGPIAISNAATACPSKDKGVDGHGGIYTATILCAGKLGSCRSTGAGLYGAIVNVSVSHWALEGWFATSVLSGASGMRGFMTTTVASQTDRVGYVAFINDIAVHTQQGFGTDDAALNHDVPGNGLDEWAVVGSIAQDSNADPICLAAVDNVAPANYDHLPGTHIFVAGNFVYNNQNPACVLSDGEGIMFDTWDDHGYNGVGVIENNISFANAFAGLQVFMQSFNASSPTITIAKNTFYDNIACPSFPVSSAGDINIQLDGGFAWTIDVHRNVSQAPNALAGCGRDNPGEVYAMSSGGKNGPDRIKIALGGQGHENVFSGVAGICLPGAVCDKGNDEAAFDGFRLGKNMYDDPKFHNVSDLLSNRLGAPDCSRFSDVASCMGWRFGAKQAAPDTVIGDLTADAQVAAGKGFQPPGACVSSDTLYPVWLRGIVYLSLDAKSGRILEKPGLMTKPCRM
jgi:hypothetical protein